MSWREEMRARHAAVPPGPWSDREVLFRATVELPRALIELDEADAEIARLRTVMENRDWSAVIRFLRDNDWTGAAADLQDIVDLAAGEQTP